MIERGASKVIVEYLVPELIKLAEAMPEVEELTQIALSAYGFSWCLEAIDGAHIPIKKPIQNYLNYINRKGYSSISAQAMCDYRYCFIGVVARWSGSVYDSGFFSIRGQLKIEEWNNT